MSLVAALGGFQGFEVVFVARSIAGSLHTQQVLQRADPNDETIQIHVRGLFVQDREGGDLRQALENVDITEIGCNQGPVASAEKGRVPEKRIELRQVPSRRVWNQIDVAGCAQVAPRIYRQPPTSTNRTSASLSRRNSSCNRSGDGVNFVARSP